MIVGEKIKKLRRERNISQDVLAQNLGVSFQAVSRWENGQTAPDISLIPAIAYFFRVSIDELFEYNSYEKEAEIDKICTEASVFRDQEPEKAKEILTKGLKMYPGNELLMNHLLYPLQKMHDRTALVTTCKALIAAASDDEIRYDACRILAETYHEMGQQTLAKEQLDKIPEIYFTKLGLKASLLEGEEAFEAAVDQKMQSIGMAVEMAEIIAGYYISGKDLKNAEAELEVIGQLLEILEKCDVDPRMQIYSYDELKGKYDGLKDRK